MPVITISGESREFIAGTTIAAIIEAYFPGRYPQPIAASVNGRVRPLNWAPDRDCTLHIHDYKDETGRRIYERSLRFLFFLAMRDILPGVRIRIEHSAGYGIFVTVHAPLTKELVQSIEQRMLSLRDAALPFVRERWTRETAMAYFESEGQIDKVRLLSYRSFTYFDVYGCNGYYEYFYGDMLPATDHIHTFSLCYLAPGILLQMPQPTDPYTVAPFMPRPQLMRAFSEMSRWTKILACENAADLNDMMKEDRLREFVRVNEALQEKAIADIADRISQRGAKVVFIAGPSCSGKTTFTNRLAIQLRVNGLRPIMLSMDHYYRNLADVPLDDEGKPDLECLESLDTPLLSLQLKSLLAGETVEVPRFSFSTNSRKPEGLQLHVDSDQPILIEGIHGLNPKLAEDVPAELSFRIYVSALTTLNLDDHNRIRTTDIRLLRRLVRDMQFRNASFDETFSMWPSVRRGEEKYIFPFQEEADIMFNSALAYEPAVWKKYAHAKLNAIDEQNPHFTMARRLVKFLNYFFAVDVEQELGPTAILREFIGGCSFYLKSN